MWWLSVIDCVTVCVLCGCVIVCVTAPLRVGVCD